MSGYVVISLEKDDNGVFHIVGRKDIEEVNLCETYNNYGNEIGCYDAGCYSFDNSDSGMHEDCIKEINEKFNLSLDYETWMCSRDDWKEYLENNEVSENKIDSILDFVDEFEEENTQHTKVKAITYWDGHNWKSIVLWNEFDMPTDGYILDPEDDDEGGELARKIIAAYEDLGGVGGISKVWKSVWHKGFWFTDDRYPSFDICEVEIDEDEPEEKIREGV